MKTHLTVATVQMTSTADVAVNLKRATALVTEAALAGAELVVLPENYGFLSSDAAKLEHAQPVDGPFTAPLRAVAREQKVVILAGSIPENGPDAGHTYNSSVLIGRDGGTLATYRKIHMFDVDLADGVKYSESAHVVPGAEPVIADVDGWPVGLTVCYDLRFPELYRTLSARGARIVTVPAAFTLHTGKDHWEPLLRARAIENLCFVVAAGQFGRHDERRVTWGKSMIIDPWGTTLAVAPEREGFVMARLAVADQERYRRELPALRHRRM